MQADDQTQFSSILRTDSLSDRVANELIAAVVDGQFSEGDVLPSERELSRQFGVSRTVVREAIRSLAAKGLATVTSGRGVVVRKPDLEGISTTLTMYLNGGSKLNYQTVHEVRSAIEVQVAGLAAQRADPNNIKELADMCEAFEAAMEAKDYDGLVEIDYRFHQLLVEASGNEILAAMVDSISDVLRKVRQQQMPGEGIAPQAARSHRRILAEIVARDPERARHEMFLHLEEARRVWSGN